MAFQRIDRRVLPDGTETSVFPFHVSMQGMEDIVLCRDEEDFDVMEKYIFICARRKNILVIIHIVMSNHTHAAVLAANESDAKAFGEEVKRVYSQYFSRKYNERKVLRRTHLDIRLLNNDSYLRNALAYIPRNALDAAARIEDYPWSGYGAMFCGGKASVPTRRVCDLSARESSILFHTHDILKETGWTIDEQGKLLPVSACDYSYLESAFCNDQAFFLKVIGNVNLSEMKQLLIENGRQRLNDSTLLQILEDYSRRWFQKGIKELTPQNKSRILPYVYHMYRTTPNQLARCFQMDKGLVERLLKV